MTSKMRRLRYGKVQYVIADGARTPFSLFCVQTHSDFAGNGAEKVAISSPWFV
jgi:hypothetical protein